MLSPAQRTSSGAARPMMPGTGRPVGEKPGAPPPEQWPTGRLFSAVARRIERDWNSHLAHWGLNHASLPVLYLLAGGPLSQRELALSSNVTEQTMSRILARLERQEFVARHPHPSDRRRHQVHLTDAGRATLLEAGDPAYAEDLTLRGLDDEQVGHLRELLLVMVDQGHEHEHGPSDDGPCSDTPEESDA
ncbi:MarR family transcriptional regulator [Isoptericola sp. b441]|uniref:MarR family transcriptional regulator n=1 Tax=Actinotalea lenta TaxID=3064654 RepID=A0ABT9DAQ7_9CELL|nr:MULTISPECIES: MarR family transcriptional regulator [unclassified Isoptericola]MDO8107989.1 MarR family transcriptional regulator [Isoptericola sp. b441]MDO8120344.1 MarR family transcriptional regulator [Isoptericola sp. b490]